MQGPERLDSDLVVSFQFIYLFKLKNFVMHAKNLYLLVFFLCNKIPLQAIGPSIRSGETVVASVIQIDTPNRKK